MNSLLTQAEAARLLGVSIKTLQLWRKSGRLHYLQFGHRTIRFAVAEIERFQQERQR